MCRFITKQGLEVWTCANFLKFLRDKPYTFTMKDFIKIFIIMSNLSSKEFLHAYQKVRLFLKKVSHTDYNHRLKVRLFQQKVMTRTRCFGFKSVRLFVTVHSTIKNANGCEKTRTVKRSVIFKFAMIS